MDEIFSALRKIKNRRTVDVYDIPSEVWKALCVTGARLLLGVLQNIMLSDKIPNEWRNSILIAIFKNKGDIQDLNNYRGIKLMSDTLKYGGHRFHCVFIVLFHL